MTTETMPASDCKVLATLSYRDLERLTRGMSPEEKATFLGIETTFPLPVPVEGELLTYTCASLSHPGETHTTDTLHKTCTCKAGQKGQLCFHYSLCRRLETFGRYRTVIREAEADLALTKMLVYERLTGANAAETMPPEGMDLGEFREWRRSA